LQEADGNNVMRIAAQNIHAKAESIYSLYIIMNQRNNIIDYGV